ncbi:hypothetical protein KBI33_00470 [Candidatus Shapirobacteria bacterium]|nr:hypothetical protein [Candidatus Shapirobacteria bacterium]
MGKKRITLVGKNQKKEEAERKVEEREGKTLKRRKVANKQEKGEKDQGKKALKRKERGKKYRQVAAFLERGKKYSPKEAVALLKKTSISHFEGKAEAHLVVKRVGLTARVNFPYPTGKQKKIAIADDPAVVGKIKKGQIDFDILLASPQVMPALLPYAKILGPAGLMPNPKNGTLVQNPQKVAEEMGKGVVVVRTEKKAPLVHLVFGQVSQPEAELQKNLQAVIEGVGKENIKKVTICATIGPGINVAV